MGLMYFLSGSTRPKIQCEASGAGPETLVHHAIALGLHTTTLILVKVLLDARGSKLMPIKRILVYSFLASHWAGTRC
ncbi:hypothetical protein H5410_052514 [Solanum commersonii]|uniref:Uncharacterized protein n=1 Tax=Solanum commersonii TaxID=4109 RepID=A0A9J5X2E4_SOLCO|nr:hypothetical protein H5410_052514 [Solanum commersonii]